jgi:cyclic pyranopterin phosphate synthase
MTPFDPTLRQRKSAAFELSSNSSARATRPVDFWGQSREVYANANLSVYSGQRCNARCAFCVEELRPASRGRELAPTRTTLEDETAYFGALGRVLAAVRPLDPSVSVTGGEPSKDPRLPRILRTLEAHGARKRTLTTNGSGLFDAREGRTVLDWIVTTGVRHLNVSRAHVDDGENARRMGYDASPGWETLRAAVERTRGTDTRLRLSCVLLRGGVEGLGDVMGYLEAAREAGIDNVVFRRLMATDPTTVTVNSVVRYSDRHRLPLEPLLDSVSADGRFTFVKQVVGYYYYVEVFRYRGVDVVFEEADLALLEARKRETPGLVHELVFHPNGALSSTWQPWDDVLGPPPETCPSAETLALGQASEEPRARSAP